MRTTLLISSFFILVSGGSADQTFNTTAVATGLCAESSPMSAAKCENDLALLDEAKGKSAQAEKRYLRALEAQQQTGDRAVPARALTLMNLGELYRRHHRTSESEAALIQSIDLARGAGKEYAWELPAAQSRLGGLYSDSEDPERGRALLTEAVARFGKLAEPQTAELGYAYNALGMVDLATGHIENGEANLRKAVALATAVLGEDHVETATYQTNLALSLILRGQTERAEALLRRARFVVEARQGPSERLGIIVAEMSTAAVRQNKFSVAEAYAQQAVTILTEQPDPDPIRIALANVNLATIYLRQRKLDEAARILPGAISEERRSATNGRILADGIRYLAELRAMQRSWRESDELYREAIGIYEGQLGLNNPAIAPLLREYADVRRHNGGSKKEIRTLEARAKAILNAGSTT